MDKSTVVLNPLKAKLNPICHLLALLGAHHILHVSRIKVKTPAISKSMHAYSVQHIVPRALQNELRIKTLCRNLMASISTVKTAAAGAT
jgi:hypothetical protein